MESKVLQRRLDELKELRTMMVEVGIEKRAENRTASNSVYVITPIFLLGAALFLGPDWATALFSLITGCAAGLAAGQHIYSSNNELAVFAIKSDGIVQEIATLESVRKEISGEDGVSE